MTSLFASEGLEVEGVLFHNHPHDFHGPQATTSSAIPSQYYHWGRFRLYPNPGYLRAAACTPPLHENDIPSEKTYVIGQEHAETKEIPEKGRPAEEHGSHDHAIKSPDEK